MRLALAAMVLLAGCVRPPDGARPLTAEEREAFAAGAQGCDGETIERAQVLITRTDEEMFHAAGYCGAVEVPGTCAADSERVQSGRCRYGCAHAARAHYRDSWWPASLWAPWYPLLVVWHRSYSLPLIEHEGRHYGDECRGEADDYHR